MFERSVVKHSGQFWKLAVAAVVFVTSAIGLAVSVTRIESISPVLFVAPLLIGLTAAVLGWVAVRCPRCRSRWVWMAVSTQPQNAWLPWLLALSECPVCGASFERTAGDAEREAKAR